MYQGIVEANRPHEEVVSMPEMLEGRYSLEEGHQLVLLNAFDVMQKDLDCKLDVFSVDTDVFVLLVGHYPHILKSVTVIRTKKEKICIGKSYNKLGPKIADALIGWYAFKGMDNTGGFASKKEASHFKAFMQADDTILDAFAAYGSTTEIPDWIFHQMERYVCILYQSWRCQF